MRDSYAEFLIKRTTPGYLRVLTAAAGFLTLVSAVFLTSVSIFGFVLVIVFGVATCILYQNMEVEYEYLYVNDTLSIDKITRKSRRKKAWEGTMEEIQIVAPSDSYVLKDYRVTNEKTLDFSSGAPGAKTRTAIVQSGGATQRIVFEPNDQILQCMRQSAPRKVMQ